MNDLKDKADAAFAAAVPDWAGRVDQAIIEIKDTSLERSDCDLYEEPYDEPPREDNHVDTAEERAAREQYRAHLGFVLYRLVLTIGRKERKGLLDLCEAVGFEKDDDDICKVWVATHERDIVFRLMEDLGKLFPKGTRYYAGYDCEGERELLVYDGPEKECPIRGLEGPMTVGEAAGELWSGMWRYELVIRRGPLQSRDKFEKLKHHPYTTDHLQVPFEEYVKLTMERLKALDPGTIDFDKWAPSAVAELREHYAEGDSVNLAATAMELGF